MFALFLVQVKLPPSCQVRIHSTMWGERGCSHHSLYEEKVEMMMVSQSMQGGAKNRHEREVLAAQLAELKNKRYRHCEDQVSCRMEPNFAESLMEELLKLPDKPIASRYDTCGASRLASTSYSRFVRSTIISIASKTYTITSMRI
jgi:hypothetical protein